MSNIKTEAELLIEDYQALVRVRSALFSKRGLFERRLHDLFRHRCNTANISLGCAWILFYRPGDYTIAAEGIEPIREPDFPPYKETDDVR